MKIFTKVILLLFVLAILPVNVCLSSEELSENMHSSFIPEQGFVPNETTAIIIAEAILVQIYGTDEIERQKPFIVSISDNVWTITGTLPKGHLGGVFIIKISKHDARVISLTHGK